MRPLFKAEAEGIENVVEERPAARKLLINGQIFVIRQRENRKEIVVKGTQLHGTLTFYIND